MVLTEAKYSFSLTVKSNTTIMKKLTLKLFTVTILMLLLSSCGGDSKNEPGIVNELIGGWNYSDDEIEISLTFNGNPGETTGRGTVIASLVELDIQGDTEGFGYTISRKHGYTEF